MVGVDRKPTRIQEGAFIQPEPPRLFTRRQVQSCIGREIGVLGKHKLCSHSSQPPPKNAPIHHDTDTAQGRKSRL